MGKYTQEKCHPHPRVTVMEGGRARTQSPCSSSSTMLSLPRATGAPDQAPRIPSGEAQIKPTRTFKNLEDSLNFLKDSTWLTCPSHLPSGLGSAEKNLTYSQHQRHYCRLKASQESSTLWEVRMGHIKCILEHSGTTGLLILSGYLLCAMHSTPALVCIHMNNSHLSKNKKIETQLPHVTELVRDPQ